jgi:hypothetical protein
MRQATMKKKTTETGAANEISEGGERQAALKRLGVTIQELKTAPEITPLLKLADGGIAKVIGAMRMVQGDDLIATFLKKYDELSSRDRRRVPIEAIALAADVDIHALLGSIMLALQAQAVSAVKIIAMTAHPAITKARARYGELPGGHRDRAALDTAMGFLPSPKGPTFIGKAIFGSGKSVMDAQESSADDEEEENETLTHGVQSDPDLDRLFPPANNMQQKLIAIRQRLLPPVPSKTD